MFMLNHIILRRLLTWQMRSVFWSLIVLTLYFASGCMYKVLWADFSTVLYKINYYYLASLAKVQPIYLNASTYRFCPFIVMTNVACVFDQDISVFWAHLHSIILQLSQLVCLSIIEIFAWPHIRSIGCRFPAPTLVNKRGLTKLFIIFYFYSHIYAVNLSLSYAHMENAMTNQTCMATPAPTTSFSHHNEQFSVHNEYLNTCQLTDYCNWFYFCKTLHMFTFAKSWLKCFRCK